MLPQGRFQAFLRSSSEDRHRLLQQLFRTERFEQVESWLRDRRLALHRRSQEHERAVSGLVHRVSETAEASLPAAEASPLPWSAELTSSAHDLAGALAAALPALRVAEQTARGELDAARAAAEQRSRYAAAARERDALLARDAEIERPTGPRRAGRSGPGRPAPAPDRGRGPRRARRGGARVRPVTGRRPPTLLGLAPEALADDAVPGLLAAAVDAAAAARALLPRERERATTTARLTTARAERDAVAARRDGLAQVGRPTRAGAGGARPGSRASRRPATTRAVASTPAATSRPSATTWSPRSSTSTRSSPRACAWSRSSSPSSRRGSTAWRPRSRAGSPSAVAAARCAAPSTTRTSRPRPSTPPTRRPRRRCASGSTTPSSRSTRGRRRPATWRPRPPWRCRPPGATTSRRCTWRSPRPPRPSAPRRPRRPRWSTWSERPPRPRSRPCGWPSSTPPSPSSPTGSPR